MPGVNGRWHADEPQFARRAHATCPSVVPTIRKAGDLSRRLGNKMVTEQRAKTRGISARIDFRQDTLVAAVY
jgi:hypothetical protein